MSRTGGCGLRRSGSGRAGSPSKSISDQNPSVPRSALAEVEVAVHPLGGPAAAPVAQGRHGVEGGAQSGDVRDQLGYRVGGRLEALHHSGCQLVGLGTAKRRCGQRGGQCGVHLGGGPAQGVGLVREVVARRERAQRELPAVLGAPQERLEHAEREAFRHGGLEPRDRRGDASATLAGERERQLQIGVGAREDPAEDLEDVGVAVHE